MIFLKEKYWHEFFEAGIFIKAINGLWETASGFALLFISGAVINNSFLRLAQNEIAEDPRDRFIYFLNSQLQHLSTNTKNFVAIYVLVHGVANLFLAYNLYKNRLWAFLASLVFVALFLLYLFYRVAHTHSIVLIGIIIFDILFMFLTWHEYKYRKSKIPSP